MANATHYANFCALALKVGVRCGRAANLLWVESFTRRVHVPAKTIH